MYSSEKEGGSGVKIEKKPPSPSPKARVGIAYLWPSNEASPEPSPGFDGSVYFPGSALVELENGEYVEISKLRIEDRVRTGPHSFSDVDMFYHRDNASYICS